MLYYIVLIIFFVPLRSVVTSAFSLRSARQSWHSKVLSLHDNNNDDMNNNDNDIIMLLITMIIITIVM
jgi:hypothetical protein